MYRSVTWVFERYACALYGDDRRKLGVIFMIHISSAQRKTLSALFEQYLPGVLVWAFGSRVKGNFRPDSDLDLVVFSKPAQSASVSSLREALDESSLPFSVDVLVWDEIKQDFRDLILEKYVVFEHNEPSPST
jgi:predicted nucleotidyltransferase